MIKQESEYNSFEEWKIANPELFKIARYRKGLIDKMCEDYGWKSPELSNSKGNGYWTKERCLEEALKYDTTTKWIKNSGSSYNKAKRMGWLSECTEHMNTKKHKPKGYWDIKENVLKEVKKYKTYSNWREKSQVSYNSALKNNWLDEISEYLPKERDSEIKWNLETCLSYSKRYKTKSDWHKNNNHSYMMAKKLGHFDKCVEHMENKCTPSGYWTKERCLEEALKYNKVNQWRKSHRHSMEVCKKNGWFEEAIEHMDEPYQLKPKGFWDNKKNIIQEVKKYKNATEWRERSGTSYEKARKKGWLKEIKKCLNKNNV
jgi:hypothetical protein